MMHILHHKLSKAYEVLRNTGILHLPTERTLKGYMHAYNSSFGFSNKLDQQLVQDSNVSTLKPFQKYINLTGDEMYIKESLVYDKNSGELIGYCNIREINNHLASLEKEYQGN